MKYAISNIAWKQADEASLLPFFRKQGITGIEVAPTMVWPEWKGLNVDTAKAYASQMQCEGFEVPSLQAIFYNKQCGSIFEYENHKVIMEHFAFIADIAAAMGASTVVFGSPSMRKRGSLKSQDACAIALQLLQTASQRFQCNGIKLCIEACSPRYGADFITKHSELLAFIKAMDSQGFGLHVDAANLYETGEQLAEVLTAGVPIQHFHISEPDLNNFVSACVPHGANLTLLRTCTYTNWVSIEMKVNPLPLQISGPWSFIEDSLNSR